MAPSEHITWFADNIAWFNQLAGEQLDLEVVSCPGWKVHDVINHLSFGLALAYPVAMSKEPSTPAEHAFDGVVWPVERPTGPGCLSVFSANMARCLRTFRSIDPTTTCWTYAGPGTASFWFRRAAIETTLHRMDVAEALNVDVHHLDDERAADAIEETLSFALPLAGQWTAAPRGGLTVKSDCLPKPVSTSSARAAATIFGEPHDVINALWGRHRDRVSVTGDQAIAAQWLSLIELAFAGR